MYEKRSWPLYSYQEMEAICICVNVNFMPDGSKACKHTSLHSHEMQSRKVTRLLRYIINIQYILKLNQ